MINLYQSEFSHSLILLNLLGASLQAQGKVQQAEVAFSDLVKLNPKNPDSLTNHGVTLQALGEADKALERFSGVLRLRPQSAEAISDYQRAFDRQPIYSAAHFNLAGLFVKQGQSQDAVEHYDSALKQNPRSAFSAPPFPKQKLYTCKDTLSRLVGRFTKAISLMLVMVMGTNLKT